jgi:hypothetical protein
VCVCVHVRAYVCGLMLLMFSCVHVIMFSCALILMIHVTGAITQWYGIELVPTSIKALECLAL